MINKKVSELDAEFIEYKAEAKATMDALEKKIDDGIGRLDASIKAMKEESDAKLDAKFEELRQLILGTAPSQSTNVDHVPQITKHYALGEKNLRLKSWDVEGSNKLEPGTMNDMNGVRLKPYTDYGVLFVEGMQPTGFGREFGVDPQAATDRDMQHIGEQIFGAGLELIVGFDLRAFEGLNCYLGKGEERITWNQGINHHPSERKGNYGLNSFIELFIKNNHVFQHFRPNDDQHERRGAQRRIWDPGIT
ncbi:hypothetical protein Tco_0272168 [Tanacetum coccineum]